MSRVRDLLKAMEAANAEANAAVPHEDGSARTRVRLVNFQPVSQTNAHGKGAVLFGLAFAAMGCIPLFAALDIIHSPDSSFHAPRWFVAAVSGLFFVLPGLAMVIHGTRGVLRERTRRNLLALHPDQPWRGDHAWDADGETRSGWRAVRRRVLQVIAFCAFLAPFHWIALREEGVRLFLVFVGLFDLVILGLAVSAGLLVVRALRYGRTRLVYERFPVHPGEELAVRFETSRSTSFDRISFRLIAVEDEYTQGRNSSSIVPWQLLEMTQEVTGLDTQPDGSGGVRATFDIPEDAPGTRLGVRPPRYWALIVRGHAHGADYHERFLMPVYARFADAPLAEV